MGQNAGCCSGSLDMSSFDANIGLDDTNVTEKY